MRYNERPFTTAQRERIEHYLAATGWRLRPQTLPTLHQWLHPTASQVVSIPLDPQLHDFSWMLARALEEIARAERRTPDEVWGAALEAERDIVRVRLGGDATVELRSGVAAIEALPKLLQVAAQSLTANRPHYKAVSHEVAAYVASLRLAQTEQGSFVLRVSSPLDSAAQTAPQSPGVEGEETPFGRRVVTRLLQSVAAARDAAAQGALTRGGAELYAASERGVSANLLDALAAFGEACEEGFAVELDWAKTLAPPDLPRSVEFERAWTPAMRQAAQALWARAQGPTQVELEGFVQRIEQATGQTGPAHGGTVWVNAMFHHKLRLVSMQLDATDYARAGDAHLKGEVVCVTGILQKTQNRWRLEAARNFGIMEADAADEVQDAT